MPQSDCPFCNPDPARVFLGHIRQIAELVRARKYLDGAGPLGSSYRVKP
jgi:hypothetical protein